MKPSRRIAQALLTVALVACAQSEQQQQKPPVDTHAAQSAPTVAAPPRDSASATPPANGGPAITERGIGKLQVGMTPAQAYEAMGEQLPSGVSWTSCTYPKFAGLPTGVWVMADQGTIARVEVRSGDTHTAEGARIGDSEARIKEMYGTRLSTQPHKYVQGGHYLVVTTDAAHRLIFETDGKLVTQIRGGRVPEVAQVEGCG